jgi:hypothetical protein
MTIHLRYVTQEVVPWSHVVGRKCIEAQECGVEKMTLNTRNVECTISYVHTSLNIVGVDVHLHAEMLQSASLQ